MTQRIGKFVFSDGTIFRVERGCGLVDVYHPDGTKITYCNMDEARDAFEQHKSSGHTYVDDSESVRELSEFLDDSINKTGKVMAVSGGTAAAFGAIALTGGGIGLAIGGAAIGIPAIAVAGIAGSIATASLGKLIRQPKRP